MIPNIASGCFLEIRTFSYFDLVVFQHEKWTLHSAFKLNGLKLHAVPILVPLFYSPKAVQWCLHTFWWINCALAQCRFCKGGRKWSEKKWSCSGRWEWVCVRNTAALFTSKYVEEAANSHFLHEISWDMAHSFFSIEALQHTTIFTEPRICWKNLWIWRICVWRIGSRRSISRSRSWVGNDGSSRGRGHPEGSQVRAGEALLSKPPRCSHGCSARQVVPQNIG